ncbi:hypothetical protein MCOR07_009445 [Pyricularia oryzae]|nr:hypothetical protein MCOR29_006341 [Pyricularia oryzae]KAI6612959.1 hypothetical protein MCOR07_009445 [Pyricularia oryzae]
MDTDTLALIVQLQLDDLEAITAGVIGKGRATEAPEDIQIAAELFRAELVAQAAVISDKAFSQSIANAVIKDGGLIMECLAAENRQPAESSITNLDDELIDKLKTLYVTDGEELKLEDSDVPHSESSSWAASRQEVVRRPQRECTSCGDQYDFTNVARCPCSHEYCRECLAKLFEGSTVDESSFPPRCCGQQIPLDPNRIFLSPELVGRFKAKRLEFEMPNRTYCHDPKCSTFVPLQFIDEKTSIAICVRCRKKTCTTCKGEPHGGDCPQDPGLQEVLALAAKEGWQRCYSCRRIVEFKGGCYHMSKGAIFITGCRCRAEFCYICGGRWKSCRCQFWEERGLVNVAAIVDDGNPRALGLGPN